jgi:hypothetical protein
MPLDVESRPHMVTLAGALQDAKAQYPWLRNWRQPFSDIPFAAGELHPIGELLAVAAYDCTSLLPARSPAVLQNTLLTYAVIVIRCQCGSRALM